MRYLSSARVLPGVEIAILLSAPKFNSILFKNVGLIAAIFAKTTLIIFAVSLLIKPFSAASSTFCFINADPLDLSSVANTLGISALTVDPFPLFWVNKVVSEYTSLKAVSRAAWINADSCSLDRSTCLPILAW